MLGRRWILPILPKRSANWVRLRPVLANWPNGSQPPTFEISANENGTAVVELAWDPQALLAPSNSTISHCATTAVT